MVQNYFNTELSDIVFDIDSQDEWKDIAKELGFNKQLDFVEKQSSPMPFPFINESMKRIFTTICPVEIEAKKFSKTPIPLEVMKTIQMCVNEKYFNKIHIWYDDKSPDPFVIGEICKYYGYKNGNAVKDEENNTKYFSSEQEALDNGCEGHIYTSESNLYLIARFGDELKEIIELKKIAIARLIDEVGGELQREVKIAQEKISIMKENAVAYMNGQISMHDLKGKY